MKAFNWIQQDTELLFFMYAFNAKIVGGAVRNSLLGIPHEGEIDLATAFKPDEMIYIANILRLKHIPTGLSHGTITVLGRHYTQRYKEYITEIYERILKDKTKVISVTQDAIFDACEFLLKNWSKLHDSDDRCYEFTTLRHDVETDGRHAKVEFTNDWKEDAYRRDFTMNALYVDSQLKLHDHVNGLKDLKAKMVRFVGNPSERICEDYLRILRFFRFNAHYGKQPWDASAVSAIKKNIQGLRQISQERLFAELHKTFKGKHAVDVIKLMDECKLFETLSWPKPNWRALNDYVRRLQCKNSKNAKYAKTADNTNYNSHTAHQKDDLFSSNNPTDASCNTSNKPKTSSTYEHADASCNISNAVQSNSLSSNKPADSLCNTSSKPKTSSTYEHADASCNTSNAVQSNSLSSNNPADSSHHAAHDTAKSISLVNNNQLHTSANTLKSQDLSLSADGMFAAFYGDWSCLKMPKHTLKYIHSLQKFEIKHDYDWYHAFYLYGLDWIEDKILLNNTQDTNFLNAFQKPFIFPVTGKDILQYCDSGPRVGVIHDQVLMWWIKQYCKPDRSACLKYLNSIV